MADFTIAVALVMKHEGGYTAGLAGDPGGETNYGIAKRFHPDLDIQNLTVEQAKDIYHNEYWRFDDVQDQSAANCLLDCAVNQGLAFALHIRGLSLKEIQVARLQRYADLNKPQFYHSWFSRTLDV